MRTTFAILGILLIASGAIILGAPYASGPSAPVAGVDQDGAQTRSLSKRKPFGRSRGTWFDQVRTLAEKANAPLSIVFGFMSLYYTRRTYHAQQNS
ncbi:MAG: hypothetical protein K0U34_07240 [Alphaproteobacteria bacterium]|nr:hypothetical protein [Alphaproteobacteria bacterium]